MSYINTIEFFLCGRVFHYGIANNDCIQGQYCLWDDKLIRLEIKYTYYKSFLY